MGDAAAQVAEGKDLLRQSKENLTGLAVHVQQSYAECLARKGTEDERAQLFNHAKLYAVQALSSVAYQVNQVAGGITQLIAEQESELTELQRELNVPRIGIVQHEELLGRQKIAELATPRKPGRTKKLQQLSPAPNPPKAPTRIPLNLGALDGVGVGGDASGNKPFTMTAKAKERQQAQARARPRSIRSSAGADGPAVAKKPIVAPKAPPKTPKAPVAPVAPPTTAPSAPPAAPPAAPPPAAPAGAPPTDQQRRPSPRMPRRPPSTVAPPIPSAKPSMRPSGNPPIPAAKPPPGPPPAAPSAAAEGYIEVQDEDDDDDLPPPPTSAPPSAGVLGRAKALYAYAATREDEMTFGEGEIIDIIAKNSDGWFEGVIGSRHGLFPGNYVEEI
eukprot:m.38704 g.38704  ORF g.38704 m.38704 type:complete len:388 (+) comp5695_c0_seq1:62-1225(+)